MPCLKKQNNYEYEKMQRIKILPESIASKIAAGEVVQRPASVVKELLENSIDAGASHISVLIKEGGKSFIQVIDDGCGMTEEDAKISFLRHSTSKIINLSDLDNIRTLGFRGEALASIAAVSQVELITQTASDDLATKIKVEGIETKEVTKDRFQNGTSVTVKNLFFNTPARRNFQKNSTAEFKHVFDVVVRIALSNPDLGIKFISEGKTVFDLKISSLKDRVNDIFGNKAGDSLIQVESPNDCVQVSGFVSRPDFSRKTRVDQFLFLNGRYIISRNLNYSVHQAYENLLEKGSFPFFILYLNLDPRKVDVNVHPSKMEVKFQDERSIYQLINSSVRQSLVKNNLVPAVQITSGEGVSSKLAWSSDFEHSAPFEIKKDWRTDIESSKTSPVDMLFRKIDVREIEKEKSIHGSDILQEFQICYQIHKQYIFLLIDDGFLIIDQHAAHERVLYEQTITNFNNSNSKSQHLLFPYTLEFSAGDTALVQQSLPDLESLGFQIKIFGKNTVVVDGVPPDVKLGQEETILQEIIDLYKENEHHLKLEPRDNLAKSFACKAAIKFGDSLNQAEMQALIGQLFNAKMPYVCPHGRPTVVKLSLDELARRFGRSV
jgi:DNA mismatch repair protein MutL